MSLSPASLTRSVAPALLHDVVFIDPGIEQPEWLLNGVVKGAEAHLLDSGQDAVAQMTAVLAGREDVANVHIVSHGSPGCLHLSGGELSLSMLECYAEQLKTWFPKQNKGASTRSLLLYGCNVATGDAGTELLHKLQALTGATIQASNTPVGSGLRGGRWQLECRTAETPLVALVFSADVMEGYSGTFALLNAGDYAALKALYLETDGANWANRTNWDVSGEAPPDEGVVGNWYGVTVADGRVTTLSLTSNQLSGEIPSELGNLSNLIELELDENELSGEIPSELGNLSNLIELDLDENELSGAIPSELGNLSNLIELELDENELSGEIPSELGSLSRLTNLELDSNSLSGEIPSELGSLSKLTNLLLYANELSGEIPSELGNLSKLTNLDLDGNSLSGEIPSELGNLSNLEFLYLGSNSLSGEIPSELGNLSKLTNLELDENELSGEIPTEVKSLSSDKSLNNPLALSGLPNEKQTLRRDPLEISLALSDIDSLENADPKDLILSIASSNTAIIPDSNIEILGEGSERTLRITPIAGQTGATTLTLTLDDGEGGDDPRNFQLDIEVLSLPLSIQAGDAPTEGTSNGSFILTLDEPAPTSGLVVSYNLGGTATSGIDYSLDESASTNITTITPNSFTITPGSISATIAVAATNDGVSDPDETLILNLLNAEGYIINEPFAENIEMSVGEQPRSVTLGDVNGDGNLDIISANGGSDSVSVLLGKGNGTFEDKADFDVEGEPYSVVTGDINQDGNLDIVAANSKLDSFSEPGTISVLLGKGDGTFEDQTSIEVGDSPRSVILEDINGDENLDIVAANTLSDNASILLGNGDGTFEAKTDFDLTGSPASVSLADLNEDGNLDLVSFNLEGGNGLSVLLGDGDGSFGAATDVEAGQFPYPGDIADVNGDGNLDIISSNLGSNNVSVLLGNGDGTFEDKTDFEVEVQPASANVVDINGDDRLDILVANKDSDSVSLLLGNGDGTFEDKIDFNVGSNPFYLAVGDVNKDGKPDFLTPNAGSNTVSVRLNQFNNPALTIRDPLPPVLALASPTATYTENSQPAILDAAATVTDPDSPNFDGGTLTVRIVAGASSEERLSIRDQGNASGQINISSSTIRLGNTDVGSFTEGQGTTPLIVTFNENSTSEVVQAVVQNLTYENLSENLISGSRTLEFTVTDGDGGTSNIVLQTLSINSIPASVPTQLNLNLSQGNTDTVNELIVVVTDNSEGSLNGLLPGQPGYNDQLLAQATTVFSTLKTGRLPNLATNRTVSVDSSANLQFAIIENGSLDSLRNGGSGTLVLATPTSGGSTIPASSFQSGTAAIALQAQLSTGQTSDITVNSAVASTAAPLGSNLQGSGNDESELLDFRGETGSRTATFEVFRDAEYDNLVGFFTIENEQGQVRDPLTNQLLNPGDAGYTQAALANRLTDVNLSGTNGQMDTFTAELAMGQLISTFIVVDGTIEQLLDDRSSNDPSIYFTHMGANADRTDHVRLIGDNTFGFEDLAGGGDMDFDDIVVRTTFL